MSIDKLNCWKKCKVGRKLQIEGVKPLEIFIAGVGENYLATPLHCRCDITGFHNFRKGRVRNDLEGLTKSSVLPARCMSLKALTP